MMTTLRRLTLALALALMPVALGARTDMRANMVDMWELAEASGNATGAHASTVLTDINTVTSGTCGTRAARNFTLANSETLEAVDSAALSLGADESFTVAMRFSIASIAGGANRFIVSKDNETSGQREWLFLFTDAVGLRFLVWDSAAAFTQAVNGLVPTLNTCYTAIGWHDAVNNVVGIKVNNGAATTAAHTTGTRDTTAAFRIGGNTGGGFHDGLVGSVVYWKRVLTDAEMTEYYNSGNGVSYADISTAAGGGSGGCRGTLLGVGCDWFVNSARYH